MSDLSARLDAAQEILQKLGAGPVRRRWVIKVCYMETILNKDGSTSEVQVPALYREPTRFGLLPDGSEVAVCYPIGDPDEPEVTQ